MAESFRTLLHLPCTSPRSHPNGRVRTFAYSAVRQRRVEGLSLRLFRAVNRRPIRRVVTPADRNSRKVGESARGSPGLTVTGSEASVSPDVLSYRNPGFRPQGD